MSTYISCVGRSRANNFSFDIHKNKDGTASIRPNKLGSDLPTSTWLSYSSVDEAKDFIENICGDLEGAERVLCFWKKSGIDEKIKQAKEDSLMKEKLLSMSAEEKNKYIMQKHYDMESKFIEDNGFFL